MVIGLAIFAERTPALFHASDEVLETIERPTRRDLPQPRDAGVLHGDACVEALGDRLCDESGALLLEELD